MLPFSGYAGTMTSVVIIGGFGLEKSINMNDAESGLSGSGKSIAFCKMLHEEYTLSTVEGTTKGLPL